MTEHERAVLLAAMEAKLQWLSLEQLVRFEAELDRLEGWPRTRKERGEMDKVKLTIGTKCTTSGGMTDLTGPTQ